jgi:uncharacterized membrane-anchored protein
MALRSRARELLLGPEIEPRPHPVPAIEGPARLGRRTKDLVKRLQPRDVAIIDHANLDRLAAEDLAATGVRAVVNCAQSSTGRYPNTGPLVLARAGVRLLDVPGAPLFDRLDDGEPVSVRGAELVRGGDILARGEMIDFAVASRQLAEHRERIDEALAEFAQNTIEHAAEEVELLAGKIEFPPVRTRFRGRHALIVVRGTTYRKDLQALRAYTPDVVLGDMDSATDAVLRSGAELIVHAYADGDAPGRKRLERLGLDHVVIPAVGTSQDVAMLLAHEEGAELIVSVGAGFNLTEFLDKNRGGMSSTFLTRLRIGETLVDAKGVSRLYNPGIRGWQMALFTAAALVLIVIVVFSSPALEELLDLIWLRIKVALGI